jgi:hypothetical protein
MICIVVYVLQYYGTVAKELEYYHKVIVCDGHRTRWKDGDWTDDSDQMILIYIFISNLCVFSLRYVIKCLNPMICINMKTKIDR